MLSMEKRTLDIKIWMKSVKTSCNIYLLSVCVGVGGYYPLDEMSLKILFFISVERAGTFLREYYCAMEDGMKIDAMIA